MVAKSVFVNNDYKILHIVAPFFISKRHFKTLLHDHGTLLGKIRSREEMHKILNKVSDLFLCESQVICYFLSSQGAFKQYLFKIRKCPNDRCDCDSVGSIQHYLFG